MTGSRIVLVDSDAHTSSLLLDELGRRGFGSVDTAPGAATLPLLLAGGEADIVIVNHRYQDHGALAACNMVRRIAPECATVVVTASGRRCRRSARGHGSRSAST